MHTFIFCALVAFFILGYWNYLYVRKPPKKKSLAIIFDSLDTVNQEAEMMLLKSTPINELVILQEILAESIRKHKQILDRLVRRIG